MCDQLTCNGAHVGAADAPPGAAATCSVYQVRRPSYIVFFSMRSRGCLPLGLVQLMCNNTLLNFDPSMTACDGKIGEVRRVCLPAAVR